MEKTDLDLAHEMAEDILDCMKCDGAGYQENLTDKRVVQDIVDRYMDTETEPTKDNFNDNMVMPGVWIHWVPGCRYNVDFPAFDEALKLKTGIDTRKLDDEGEEKFYNLKNCKKIFKALNPLYKQVKEIVFDAIMDDPSRID